MKQRLTDAAIARIQRQLDGERTTLTDTDIRGFFAEIRQRSATFALRASVNGKQRIIKLGNFPTITAEEARMLCMDRKRSLSMGAHEEVLNPRKDMLFDDFVEQHYLPWYKLYRRKLVNFTKTYHNHFRHRFSSMMLHQITRQHIQAMAAELRGRGYAPSTVNNIVLHLRAMLKRADEWHVARVHPSIFKSAPLQEIKTFKERYLTPEEAARLQQELDRYGDAPIANAVRFLLYTGTRKRETLDAEWRHIDEHKRTWRIPLTKNGRPHTVFLGEGAMQILDSARTYQQREFGEAAAKTGWVFANPSTLKPYGCIYHTWNRVRQRAGLADVRLHDLRHSFASTLVNSGVSLYEVQHLLGHANPATTQRYAHLADSKLHDTVGAVDRAYGRK